MDSLKSMLKVLTKSGKEYFLPGYRRRHESPQMSYVLPLPETEDEIYRELLNLNPNLKYSQLMGWDKLMIGIQQTLIINRSVNQAMILLIGTTGVGKSSIINHLFNISENTWKSEENEESEESEKREKQFAETGSSKSTTNSVKEYLLSVDSAEYDVSELKMGFIDSPGFQDSQHGTEGDAKSLRMIRLFLDNHPNLRGKSPNLIFMCVAANDVRYEGETSNFVKSLKCLKELNIVDVKNPNIIVVITKCCQIEPNHMIKKKNKEWMKNIENMKNKIKTIVLKELEIDAPIVILENNYEDQGLERPRLADGSPSDFTLLPNEDLQPYNLFVSCLETMQRSGDLFGEIIFNACFMDGSKAVPKMGFEISGDDVSLNESLTNERKVLDIIEKKPDFLTCKVETFFKQSELEEKEKQEIYLIKAELKKLGVSHEEEMCLITPEAVGFSLPNGLSVRGREFLEKYLNIRSNEIKPEISEVILHGYNILNDKVINNRIFNKSLVNHEYGFGIPDGCTIKKINDDDKEAERSDQFRDMIGLVKHRLHDLNLDFTDADLTRFNYPNRPGCVVDDVPNSHLSCLHEYRLFRIDCESIQNLSISDNFKQDVQYLPKKFNPDDTQSRGQFKSFFNKWGHYVVVSVYGGGYCESKISQTNPELAGEIVKLQGGDAATRTIKSLDETEKIDQWKRSLILNPLLLKRELSLVPISDVVNLVKKEKGREVSKAFNLTVYGTVSSPIPDRVPEIPPEVSPDDIKIRSLLNVPLTRKQAYEKDSSEAKGIFPKAWYNLKARLRRFKNWLFQIESD